MTEEIGYAVVVWNQASHQAGLLDYSFTDDLDHAREIAATELSVTNQIGRRETYSVVKLVEVES
jgi:hypothetical protein